MSEARRRFRLWWKQTWCRHDWSIPVGFADWRCPKCGGLS